jgi:hypothetical protein
MENQFVNVLDAGGVELRNFGHLRPRSHQIA